MIRRFVWEKVAGWQSLIPQPVISTFRMWESGLGDGGGAKIDRLR